MFVSSCYFWQHEQKRKWEKACRLRPGSLQIRQLLHAKSKSIGVTHSIQNKRSSAIGAFLCFLNWEHLRIRRMTKVDTGISGPLVSISNSWWSNSKSSIEVKFLVGSASSAHHQKNRYCQQKLSLIFLKFRDIYIFFQVILNPSRFCVMTFWHTEEAASLLGDCLWSRHENFQIYSWIDRIR